MKLILFTLLAGVASCSVAHAVPTAISNLSQTTSGTTFAIGKSVPAFNFQQGVSFTTGVGSFNLDSVTLSFYSKNGLASGFTASLYTSLTATGPSGLVAMLTGNSTPSTGLETYSVTNSTLLNGGTTYWLVLAATATSANSGFSLDGTNSLAEDVGAYAGWSIGDTRMVSNNGGNSWFEGSTTSGVLQFSVQASPVTATVPDCATTAVLLGVGLIGLSGFRRRYAAAI